MLNLRVLVRPWIEARVDALSVRLPVFVEEQGVPLQIEEDEWDPRSDHALVYADARCVGTGRLLPDGHIGRVAVLRAWRGKGIGTELMTVLAIRAMELEIAELVLHAQVQALPFYERLGFIAEGPQFDEAGIAHRTMRRRLVSGPR